MVAQLGSPLLPPEPLVTLLLDELDAADELVDVTEVDEVEVAVVEVEVEVAAAPPPPPVVVSPLLQLIPAAVTSKRSDVESRQVFNGKPSVERDRQQRSAARARATIVELK